MRQAQSSCASPGPCARVHLAVGQRLLARRLLAAHTSQAKQPVPCGSIADRVRQFPASISKRPKFTHSLLNSIPVCCRERKQESSRFEHDNGRNNSVRVRNHWNYGGCSRFAKRFRFRQVIADYGAQPTELTVLMGGSSFVGRYGLFREASSPRAPSRKGFYFGAFSPHSRRIGEQIRGDPAGIRRHHASHMTELLIGGLDRSRTIATDEAYSTMARRRGLPGRLGSGLLGSTSA